MNNNMDLDNKLFDLLGISSSSKVYNSNIGFIIVSAKGDYVYKIYTKKSFFNKEILIYSLLESKGILVPEIKILGEILEYSILRLENIRKHYRRKNELIDLDLPKVAVILSKIHGLKKDGKHLILCDIHSSNFFEVQNGNDIKLGIFDFSSSKYGLIEEDLANIYIDLGIDNKLFNIFVDSYNIPIDFNKLYILTIYELFERIKNGMNLSLEKKKKYYKFIIKIKELNENKDF